MRGHRSLVLEEIAAGPEPPHTRPEARSHSGHRGMMLERPCQDERRTRPLSELQAWACAVWFRSVQGCIACGLASGRAVLPGGVLARESGWVVEHRVAH